jgi:hypothetical protein
MTHPVQAQTEVGVIPVPFELFMQDAVSWLVGQPGESVDLLITDPAHESPPEKHRAIGTTTRLKHSKTSSNDWFNVFPNARFPELFAEVFRVLKRNTHFYLFCDAETMFVAKPEAERAGFKFWKPLVWDKRTIGMAITTARRVHPLREGKRRLNDLVSPTSSRCRESAVVIRRRSPGRRGGPDSSEPELGDRRRSIHGIRQRSGAAGGLDVVGNDLNPKRCDCRAALARIREGCVPADTYRAAARLSPICSTDRAADMTAVNTQTSRVAVSTVSVPAR